MPYRFAQRLVFSIAGAILVCVLLFLLSGLLTYSPLKCCGYSMGFPLLCLGTLLSLFSIIPFLFRSMHKQGDGVLSPAASSKLFQHLTSLVLSDYLRGWFFASLLLSMTLVLLGAVLLFSLSLSFSWSALALGCLSVLDGLGVLLLGGYRLLCG